MGWSLPSSSWDKIVPIAKLLASVSMIVGKSGLKCYSIGTVVNKDFSLPKDFSASVDQLNLFRVNFSFVKSVSGLTTLEKLFINRQ
jgi:hypothetical protein